MLIHEFFLFIRALGRKAEGGERERYGERKAILYDKRFVIQKEVL